MEILSTAPLPGAISGFTNSAQGRAAHVAGIWKLPGVMEKAVGPTPESMCTPVRQSLTSWSSVSSQTGDYRWYIQHSRKVVLTNTFGTNKRWYLCLSLLRHQVGNVHRWGKRSGRCHQLYLSYWSSSMISGTSVSPTRPLIFTTDGKISTRTDCCGGGIILKYPQNHSLHRCLLSTCMQQALLEVLGI